MPYELLLEALHVMQKMRSFAVYLYHSLAFYQIHQMNQLLVYLLLDIDEKSAQVSQGVVQDDIKIMPVEASEKIRYRADKPGKVGFASGSGVRPEQKEAEARLEHLQTHQGAHAQS